MSPVVPVTEDNDQHMLKPVITGGNEFVLQPDELDDEHSFKQCLPGQMYVVTEPNTICANPDDLHAGDVFMVISKKEGISIRVIGSENSVFFPAGSIEMDTKVMPLRLTKLSESRYKALMEHVIEVHAGHNKMLADDRKVARANAEALEKHKDALERELKFTKDKLANAERYNVELSGKLAGFKEAMKLFRGLPCE